MKVWFRLFFLSCKRAVKKPFILLFLLLLPLGTGAFRQAEQADDGKIAVALFTGGSEFNDAAADVLMGGEYALDFYRAESPESLRADVAAGRAECGYIFPDDLRERLENGDYKRCIRLVVSPATVTAGISSEAVFAGLFRLYGRELLEKYVRSGAAFGTLRNVSGADQLWQELEPVYERYLSDGSTFSFEYETVNGGILKENAVMAVFPARGMGAVLIFVMGLAAAVMAGEDEKRGLFAAVGDRRRRLLQLAEIAAFVFLGSVSAGIALMLSGSCRGAAAELAILAVYGCMTVVFSFLLLTAVRNPLAVAGTIPFFILGSLAVCPVFADLSIFVPALKIVRYFFLPWYYLMF